MSVRAAKNKLVRQARDFAQAIMETIRDPLVVLDGEMRVLTANASFYQTFCTAAQETEGRLIFDLGDGQWNIPKLRQLLERLLETDARIENVEVHHEFRAIGHRHMLLNASQIHREGAGSGMILLAITDTTGQLAARKALERSEARYRAIVEDQTELICRFLPDGALTFVNDAYCRYFGKRSEELIGHDFLDIMIPESEREPIRQELAAFTVDNPVLTTVRQTAPPRGRWRQWVTRAFFDDKGRIVEFQAAGRDITEIKQGEAALLHYRQELRALTARLISVQEAESKRLARELHDVFSQKLAVLGMEIGALEQRAPESPEALRNHLHEVAREIIGLAKDIHQMSRRIHPVILDDLGLAAALNYECLAFSGQYGIPTEFTPHDVPGQLPEDISLCLYRVAQESLRNTGKYAGASRVRVSLTGGTAEIALAIEDTGTGFKPDEARRKGGLGLVSMDERVRLVGGTFSIQSEPGKGTRVDVRVPVPGRET
jgi:PAS domain S-box-containing protein